MIQSFEDIKMFAKAIRLKSQQGYKFYVEPHKIIVASDNEKLPVYIWEYYSQLYVVREGVKMLDAIPVDMNGMTNKFREIIFEELFKHFLGFKLKEEESKNPVDYMLSSPCYFEVKRVELMEKIKKKKV